MVSTVTSIYTKLAEVEPASWPAYLSLEFQGSDRGTRMMKSSHQGPLYVQKVFYPEGKECAHVYLLHPPGGIVSGDHLSISIALESTAHTLVTTPGATRLYRARVDKPDTAPLPQKIVNTLSLNSASVLEWFPCETIVFDGANIDLETQVNLDEHSQFSGWEITCLGLPASEQKFLSGTIKQTFSVNIDGAPQVIDRFSFDADSIYLNAQCGLQGQPVFGSFISGPFTKNQDSVISKLRGLLVSSLCEECFAVTHLNDFVVMRYLGQSSEHARKIFVQAWELLRPELMDLEAVHPRIWAT